MKSLIMGSKYKILVSAYLGTAHRRTIDYQSYQEELFQGRIDSRHRNNLTTSQDEVDDQSSQYLQLCLVIQY